MKKLILISLLALSNTVMAQNTVKVVSTTPKYVTVNQPVCTQQLVESRSVAATVIGGTIGAAAGSLIGNGTGQLIAMTVGGLAGSAIGQNMTHDFQPKTICRDNLIQVQQGSIITFMYKGQLFTQDVP